MREKSAHDNKKMRENCGSNNKKMRENAKKSAITAQFSQLFTQFSKIIIFVIIISIIIITMIKVVNPFITGKYVSREYFCDREQETEQLRHHMVNGRNVALISPRRLGKTGLIEHFFSQDDIAKEYDTIFVDIYSTSTLEELVYQLGKAIFAKIEKKSSVVERFFSVIKTIRLGFKLDAVSGEPTLELGLGDIDSAEKTLSEIFEYIDTADRPCIIAIDEFQQITSYEQKNVEAVLRTHIQHCRNAQFIFAGSKRHVMTQMFTSAAKPFYQSAIVMGLEAIPMETYIRFARNKFEQYGKSIDIAAVEKVYRLMSGCTWYMQMMMNELFALTSKGEICGTGDVGTAIDNIVNTQAVSYSELMTYIGTKQKAVLMAIAKEGETAKVTSAMFIKKHSLASSSSVQAAIKGLMEKDIITQENGSYRVYDYFFGVWIKRQY